MKGVEGRKELQKQVIFTQQRTRTRTRKYKLSRRREPRKSSKGVEGRKELRKLEKGQKRGASVRARMRIVSRYCH